MKRLLIFKMCEEDYVLVEDDNTIFSINSETLKFDSLSFYKGLYSGLKTTNIILEKSIEQDSLKKGEYIFNWLSEIIDKIRDEFHEFEEDEDILETEKIVEEKTIYLFDIAACAGDGFFIGSDETSGKEIRTTNIEADYAIRISGASMEPDILDGSTVLVKKCEEIRNDEIGIFIVDGSAMCKRFYKSDGRIHLVPNNSCGDYKTIEISQDTVFSLHGKVIGVL
ncbi:S24 family peptidase [Robinsoniella peoriensis]|uniref:S24 family peptidase n=1 Tax=Robinsoniella peoriensis TaxID=180332 RepID=UPI0036442D79